jgi:hypothetical protein
LLRDHLRLNSPDTNGKDWGNDKEDGWSCAENGIKLYSKIGTQPLAGTIFYSKSSPIPAAYISGEIDVFVEFLHICHEHLPKSKEESYLFSPAIIDPTLSTSSNRGKENVAYLRHIVLDFENGELLPETLPTLFPRLQMVITNTFRHRRDRPRFRAVLFTDELMTAEGYGLIYTSIANKLEEAGRTTFEPVIRENGIDFERVRLAIETWRTSPLRPGQGDAMFFNLALSLKYAGMDFHQIESTLRSEARYGVSWHLLHLQSPKP